MIKWTLYNIIQVQSTHRELVHEEQVNDLVCGGPSVHSLCKENVLVKAEHRSIQHCQWQNMDCEAHQWRVTSIIDSPVHHFFSSLTAEHNYSKEEEPHSQTVTVFHKSGWQQEQFERRYEELQCIGKNFIFL